MAPRIENSTIPTERTAPQESISVSPTTAASGRMQSETIEPGNTRLWRPQSEGANTETFLPNTTIGRTTLSPESANGPKPQIAPGNTVPAETKAPVLDAATVKKYTHELYEAINSKKPDNDKIQHILGSLSEADRKAIEEAYKHTEGNTDNRAIRTELKDRLGDNDYRKAEAELNKRDGRTNDAGNLMVALSSIKDNRDDGERRVLETFSTLNSQQQDQLRKDFKNDYGKDVDQELKDFGVSEDAMKAITFVSKPVEQRSAQDIEAFARFAIEKHNLDYFGLALRGGTAAAVQARQELSGNQDFKKQIVDAFKVHQDGGESGMFKRFLSAIPGGDVMVGGINLVEGLVKGDLDFDRLTEGTNFDKLRKAVESKEVDSKLLQAMDILHNGQVSLATIAADNTGSIFGWFDNKNAISNAAEHATDSEKKMFARGQQLAQGEGEAKSDEDKNALSFYKRVHEALAKAGNDNEPLKWEDRLLNGKDGSVVSQLLDNNSKEGRFAAIESLSQKDWERLKDPAAGKAFRKQIEDQLTKDGNKDEAAAIMKLLDEKLAAGSYADSQKLLRSVSDLVTMSPDGKTAVDTIAALRPEEAARYQTDSAFRSQVDQFVKDHLNDLGQIESTRLLAQIAKTGKAPQKDAIDRLFSDKLKDTEGKKAITDIEAVLQDTSLRQKLAGPESALNDVEKQIKKTIEGYISAATPESQIPSYDGATVTPEPKDDEYLQALYQNGRLTVEQKAKLNWRAESFFSEAATVSPEERHKLYDSGLISSEEKQLVETLTTQGGKMNLADQIRASVIKDGTDAESFANQLKGLSPEDKQKLKDEYAKKYGSALEQDVINHVSDEEKNNFRTYLTAGAVDGRQDFYDNLERALHSESGYTPDGSKEVLERALSTQGSMLSDFQSRFEKLPPEKQAEANQLFTAALKDYQESKEKFAEKLYQAAVIVGGVAVGVATGGVGFAALATVVAIGAVGRIALKKAIQGNDYDISLSNALKDGAIGAVTAGLSVLGPETIAAVAGVGKVAASSFLTAAGEQVGANIIKGDARAILEGELNNLVSSSVVRGQPISKEALDGIVAKIACAGASNEEKAALSAALQSTLETSGRQITEDAIRSSFSGMARQAAAFGTIGGTANTAIEGTVGLANGNFDPGQLPQSFLVGFGMGAGMSAGLETAVRGAGKYASRDALRTPPETNSVRSQAEANSPADALARIEDCRRGRMPAGEALENGAPYSPENTPSFGDAPKNPAQIKDRNFKKSAQIADAYIQLADTRVSPSAGKRIIIGRNPSCDFQLISPQSSRIQSEIELTGNGPVIRDLSRNTPTLVNGHAVPQEGFRIRNGDIIEMGGDRVVFGGAYTKAKPLEYMVSPGMEDIAAAQEPLRQSTRMKDASEISERLLDGFQVYSHDVEVRFNENFLHPQAVPVVFDVLDRSQDVVLQQTIREAHARFDALKSDPQALADELARFSKAKLTPRGWSEDMVDDSSRLFLQANQGKRMLLGNYINMAQRGEGAGVCLQQAFLFKVLADDFGLDSTLVYGHYGNIGPINQANLSANHAWNQVRLDGQSLIYDPRQQKLGLGYDNAPKHLPLRNVDRPADTRVYKLNQLNLKPGDQVTYNGSTGWKVSSETSKQPGDVVLLHDAVKTVSMADFIKLNPNRPLVVGQMYELLRSNGEHEIGWIYEGLDSTGRPNFRKSDAVREEVPVAVLKEAFAPRYAPYPPDRVRVGDSVYYEGDHFKIAQIDSETGKPILYKQNRGKNFVNAFSPVKPEDLAQYRAMTLNGNTIYTNSDLSAFYNVSPGLKGQLMMFQNHEYVLADNPAKMQVLINPESPLAAASLCEPANCRFS